MTGTRARGAVLGLFAGAVLVAVSGCAAQGHWMTGQPSAAAVGPGARSAPATSPGPPASPRDVLTVRTSVATPPPAQTPSATVSSAPTSSPSAVAATVAGSVEGVSQTPIRHRRHARHHFGGRGGQDGGQGGNLRPAAMPPVITRGPSLCNALAQEGGLPGNLAAQCHKIYG